MTDEISNTDDVIDSRDIIARIEELESLMGPETTEDEIAELEALKALAAEAEPYAPDWIYGAALIRDSYFEQYAEELVKDCGYIPQGIPSWIEIDWEATAENIKVDYTSVEFDDVTYWIR
jgi:hypothetical protein